MNISKLGWILALTCAHTFGAGAAAAAEKVAAVHGVRLATLCAQCAVVNGTIVERRKGEASGVGAIGGAVAGGVIGNKSTDGGTLGTVGGAAVGGLLGNEIEKRVKRHKVWVTTVTLKDGSTRRFESASDPGWRAGSVVEVAGDRLRKRG